MRFSAETQKYLSWIIHARKQQEAKDLIAAAINCKTWKVDHALEAIKKSLGRSDWQRALLVAKTCLGQGFDLPSEAYSKLIKALVIHGNHEIAWEALFRSVHRENILISVDSLRELERMTFSDPKRHQILSHYLRRNKIQMHPHNEAH